VSRTWLKGSWRPGWVAVGRLVRAQLTARGTDPAFSDAAGTLSRGELWSTARARSRQLTGPVLVHTDDARSVVVDALAGLLAGQTVIVVPPRAGQHALRAARAADPGRRGVFFTTSGTTGTAHLVRSRRGVRALVQLASPIGVLPAVARPVVASLAPVNHGHGFTAFLTTMALGGHFVALGDDPAAELAALEYVDVLTGVPVQLRQLAEACPRPPTRIGLVLSGSDRLVHADAVAAALGAAVYDAYGTTETGTVTVATPADRLASPGTVGRPLPGVRISADGGRLVLRSPLLGRGSWAADRGFIRDGLVHVTGRVDGVRVSGGENTSPQAVRDWLLTFPGVTEVSFTERQDDRFGTRPVALVTAAGELDPHLLRDAIRAEFGPAATPAEVVILPVGAGAP